MTPSPSSRGVVLANASIEDATKLRGFDAIAASAVLRSQRRRLVARGWIPAFADRLRGYDKEPRHTPHSGGVSHSHTQAPLLARVSSLVSQGMRMRASS